MDRTPKPYLVAFKATGMETRTSIVDWLRDRDAVHMLADVWMVKLAQTSAGDISHSIIQYDQFNGQLLVLGLNGKTDWSNETISDEARSWIRENLHD
jgi:hypothetical protein